MKVACALLSDFEVAVEMARYPDLAGKPVIVGGLPHERKTVRSRSAEAAASGVTEGMPLREAQGLCPEAVFLPADDDLYLRALSRVLTTLDAFSPRVEMSGGVGEWVSGGNGQKRPPSPRRPLTHSPTPPLSVYLDASGLEMLFGPDRELGERIAAAVEMRTHLQARVGIGSSKFVAQMAAVTAAPGESVVVRPGEERAFLAPLPVDRIPCSDEMRRRLDLFGLRTMGQLASLPRGALGEQFGKEGVEAARLARGIDERPIMPRNAPAILKEEMEIDPPTGDNNVLMSAAERLAKRLERRMKSSFVSCQDVALDLGFENRPELHLSTTLHDPTDKAEDLLRAVERLLGRAYARVGEGEKGEVGSVKGEGGWSEGLEQDLQDETDGQDGPMAGPEQGLSRNGGYKETSYLSSPEIILPIHTDPEYPVPALPLHPSHFTLHPSLPVPPSPTLPLSHSPTPYVSLLRLSLSGFGNTGGEQLELLPTQAGSIKKVQRAVSQAEELFGKESLHSLKETSPGRLPSSRIGVNVTPDGWPDSLLIGNRKEKVREITNHWRVQEEWWRREVLREYYRIITEAGSLCLIYQDLLGGGWFLERIYG